MTEPMPGSRLCRVRALQRAYEEIQAHMDALGSLPASFTYLALLDCQLMILRAAAVEMGDRPSWSPYVIDDAALNSALLN
jgi:hypothetical protein